MNPITYPCPCCCAPLTYGAGGKLTCASCGNAYDVEAIEALNADASEGSVSFARPETGFDDADSAQMHAYICQGCGAELMTEGTTTATECPYCGSPAILPDRIEGSVKPAYVVPFTVTKEQAQKSFEDYFKGKRLLPNVFLTGRNRIADMRKLYVPYWLFSCDATACITYDAQRRRTERQGDWEITHVEHYAVRRDGTMSFTHIPVDGSEKLDNRITESLEPYDLSAAVPFSPAVLAGAMADHADVDADACEGRAKERVENSIADALYGTVNGYSTVTERSRRVSTQNGAVTPVLMPVWLITTQKEGTTYTFAINGQTGKLTCDVPADMGKSFAWGGGVFAGVLALGALALYLTENLASGTLLLCAVLAAVIALAVVGALRSQLKQAVHQSAAGHYVKDGSFDLRFHFDHFLYETTERRKIETQNKKN